MLEILSKGGILVIPLVFCSVLVLAIFCERVIRLSINQRRGRAVEEQVATLLASGDMEAARRVSDQSRSPMGRVLVKAIEAMDLKRQVLETVIVNAVEREIREMSAYLQTLATIGNIAPLLGLLGTIIGMIKAFMVIQQMGGKVNAAVLAGGIWEAMLTTALGLGVALPTMVAHSYLVSRVDAYEARLQNGSVSFLKAIGKKAV